MINIVIEVSKYLMILLIAAYTYWNFSYFRFHDPDRQGSVCIRQNITMFLMHFVAYAVLFLKSEDKRVLLFYLAQVIFTRRLHGALQDFLSKEVKTFSQ